MQEDIITTILDWPEMQSGCHLQALVHHISAKLNRPVSQAAILTNLETLAQEELLDRDGPLLRLKEPDRRELDLYEALEGRLSNQGFFERIGIHTRSLVFQRTATGGPLGHGLLSRPDFTLATIQSWRFDPRRTLEVYSFEVKNRSGASLPAVYEAVAHGRMVHHPYLVCPRSRFSAEFNAQMQNSCLREGVGLISFDIVVADGDFKIERLERVVVPQRRTPDPLLVQEYLESRLSEVNQARLASYASGGG